MVNPGSLKLFSAAYCPTGAKAAGTAIPRTVLADEFLIPAKLAITLIILFSLSPKRDRSHPFTVALTLSAVGTLLSNKPDRLLSIPLPAALFTRSSISPPPVEDLFNRPANTEGIAPPIAFWILLSLSPSELAALETKSPGSRFFAASTKLVGMFSVFT